MKILMTSLCALLLWGCGEEQIPGGSITVRNDILDKEYNTFVVDEVITKGGMQPFGKTFRPHEEVALPYKHIQSMRFTRQYKDHAKIYVVSCPEGFDRKVTVKLIDVHLNRMGGGCVLRRKGERSLGGFVTWEDE